MTSAAAPVPGHGQLWADKYKPRTIAEMCYPVCANKLKAWLTTFEPAGRGDSKKMRGVLLSGPPGIGKTTTVHVVAEELGYTVVEYNASDFRSRKSLHEHVATLTENRAFSNDVASYATVILLMDEVDGCDIGGVGEVIEMLKTTQMPIICTCNDRWHPKLRSLLNYVEDFRFTRPPCNIVANFLFERVLAREGISLSKSLLQDIVKRSGSDIRNMLANLQLWCLKEKSFDLLQLAAWGARSEKNGDAGLFEAAEYFLLQGTAQGQRHSISDLEAAYYNNDLIDMFVQENYIHFSPPGVDHLACTARAASSISRSDAAQRMMYLEQNWSVSRAYVLLSSIAPCLYTRGKYVSFLEGQQMFFDRQRPVKFPSWLGQNSTAGKNKRLLRCVTVQAQCAVSGNQEDVVLDYMPLGWERPLTQPLATNEKDGIADVIGVMDAYSLTRDDWDLVQSVSHFRRMQSKSVLPTPDIATAVKSAFTREFNRTHRTDSLAKGTLKNVGKGEDDVGPAEATAAAEDADETQNTKDTLEVAAMRVTPKPKRAPAAKKAGGKKAATAKAAAPQPKRARAASKTAGGKPTPKKAKSSGKRRRTEDGSDGSSSDSESALSNSRSSSPFEVSDDDSS